MIAILVFELVGQYCLKYFSGCLINNKQKNKNIKVFIDDEIIIIYETNILIYNISKIGK